MTRYSSAQRIPPSTDGFILLLSVLISSIILAISFGVYALSIKEVYLSSYLKNSAMAFATADRAVECALYWDRAYPQNGMPYTIFANSTSYIPPANLVPDAVCDGVMIGSNLATGWTQTTFPTHGTTAFSLTFADGTCADVSVKKDDANGTIIAGNGYNNCNPNDPRRTQRTIVVSSPF